MHVIICVHNLMVMTDSHMFITHQLWSTSSIILRCCLCVQRLSDQTEALASKRPGLFQLQEGGMCNNPL